MPPGRKKNIPNKLSIWPPVCQLCGDVLSSKNASGQGGRRPHHCKACARDRVFTLLNRRLTPEQLQTKIDGLTRQIKILTEILEDGVQ
jgi:tRNA(Ile2) C34 agmatinyltransferase TiaS